MSKSAHPAAATLYANQLIQRKEGYPLWQPDPGGRPSVQIADVGYIIDGGFIRLFHAGSANGGMTDDDIVPVPKNYVPLEIGDVNKRMELQAQFPITTGSVSEIGVSNNVAGSVPGMISMGVEFKFQSTKEAGAVLVLREDAVRRDALRKLAFLRYIREHHATWLAFANNDTNARGITLNDLLLVTGWDKTTAWACAAFTENSHSGGFSFQAGQAPIATGGMSLWGSWRNFQAPYAQVGPSLRSRNPNQCVFIRGYKVCDRITLLARKARRAANDGFNTVSPGMSSWFCFPFHCGTRKREAKLGPGHPVHAQMSSWEVISQPSSSNSKAEIEYSDASKKSMFSEIKPASDPDVDKEKFETCLQLNHNKDLTPLDILLHYILENSKAKIAIVHDDDLISLLKTGQTVNNFETWIRDLAPPVYLDDQQVGMLQTTYEVSQSEQEIPPMEGEMMAWE